MRNKSVFLLIACVCGTIAAIGVSQWMQAQNVGRTELKTVEIFVTSRSIDVAEEITAEKIKLEQWPADRIPEGSTGNLKDLEGKFAKQRFYAGEPVMPVKLMDDSNSNSSSIPRGYSVVSMKADADGSATNLVSPGDRVDVMAYFTKSDLVPETTAKTVLRGIRVFAIDGKTDREELAKDAKPAKNISLLIHKNDAPVWTYATELGKVRLQLCNPGEYTSASDGDEANVAGQEFLSWLAENQAAKEARKVVEPAPYAQDVW
jgi:pilus assembly protein CpaB